MIVFPNNSFYNINISISGKSEQVRLQDYEMLRISADSESEQNMYQKL